MESVSLLSVADAQKHLEKELELDEKRAKKLVDMIKDESGEVSKESLDKLTAEGRKA